MISRRTFLGGALALYAVAASAAARADEKAPAAGTDDVKPGIVDGATAHRLVAAGVKVVDVRTPAEFDAGHVPGALNIPHDQMPQRFAEIGPPSTPVLLYCASGRRTRIAEGTLREKGYSAIYDMQAYARWVESEPR